MVHQLRGHDVAFVGPWVRKARLATLALLQAIPLVLGGWMLATSTPGSPLMVSPSLGRVLAAVALIAVGIICLRLVWSDWRGGRPFNRRRTLWVVLALIVSAPALLIVASR